jgi:hypothetical protein
MIVMLVMACGGSGGETIDLVEGTYRGFPADGEPDDGVRVNDEGSTFTIAFFEHDTELWADLDFRGKMTIHGFVIKEEENTIEGVTVDGTDLACKVFIEGFSFQVEGVFSADFGSLFLDVQHVGTMTVFLEVEDEEGTEDVSAV